MIQTFSIRKAAALMKIPAKAVAEVLDTLPDDPGSEEIAAAFVSAARAEGAPAALLNVSQLHRITSLDRTTITKRLAEAGVAPAPGSKAKERLFDIESSLAALVVRGSENLDRSKQTKTEAEAQLAMLKVQRQRGEVVSLSEVREHAYNLVRAMHQRFAQYAKEAKRRLKLKPEQSRALETDFSLIFDDLKRDYPKIFPEEKAKPKRK